MGDTVEIFFYSYEDALGWYANQEGIKMVHIDKAVKKGKLIKFVYKNVAS